MTSVSPVSGPAAPRVAVLIDGDNIPQSFRPEIDRHARALGCVVSGQVFGDIALHSDWAKETGLDIHHCKGKQGGNAADITLVIAALDLAYRGLAQGFLIVSNDRDFEPLLRHLVKIGCSAVVLKTSPKQAVLAAVTPTTESVPTTPLAAAPKKAATDEVVFAEVKDLIRTKGDAGGLRITLLNSLYAKTGFRVSQTTAKTWRAWLLARPRHFELDPKGPESRVRLVRAGKNANGAAADSATAPNAARSAP